MHSIHAVFIVFFLFQYLYVDLVQGLPPSKVSPQAEESLQDPETLPSLAYKSLGASRATSDSPGDESDLSPDPLANVKLYFMDENGAVTLGKKIKKVNFTLLLLLYMKMKYKWASEVFNGFEWVTGPDHPKGVSFIDSCTVQVNTTHSLVVGGMASMGQSWLYDWQVGRWTEAGKLNRPRQTHSCVAVEDLGVLVVGGTDHNSNREHTVELFDPVNGRWSLQPSLPNFMETYRIIVLQWQGTVIALANRDDRVFKREDDGSWGVLEGVLLPQEFKGGQNNHAVIVHDEYGLGCL